MVGEAGGNNNMARSGHPPAGRTDTYAAIDLGTNNCRLLIARPEGDGFRVLDAFSRVVRLGEGVGATGVLCEEAVCRTIAALKVCANKMRRRHVTVHRSVATEACRRACNCPDFLERVKDQTGIDLEIISTKEEARLALTGVLPLIHDGAPMALVFDIGGGSTELIWLELADRTARVLGSHSIPCGVINMAERYGMDSVCDTTYAAMMDDVQSQLAEFESEYGIRDKVAAGHVQVVGTSGTVTTVASVHLGLRRYADRWHGHFGGRCRSGQQATCSDGFRNPGQAALRRARTCRVGRRRLRHPGCDLPNLASPMHSCRRPWAARGYSVGAHGRRRRHRGLSGRFGERRTIRQGR